jgi:hypothetical protein
LHRGTSRNEGLMIVARSARGSEGGSEGGESAHHCHTEVRAIMKRSKRRSYSWVVGSWLDG